MNGGRRARLVGSLLLGCGVVLLIVAARQPATGAISVELTNPVVFTPATTLPTPSARPGDDLVSSAQPPSVRPVAGGSVPVRLEIPSVGLASPIVEVSAQIETVAGQPVRVWPVADYAVGHHNTSANPGQGGNVVLAGHDDWHGEVFRDLHAVRQGALIVVTTADGQAHRYVVTTILLRQEVGVPLRERLETGRLIEPMAEERLTLVTCWPYGVDDHRLIVIAHPVPEQAADDSDVGSVFARAATLRPVART